MPYLISLHDIFQNRIVYMTVRVGKQKNFSHFVMASNDLSAAAESIVSFFYIKPQSYYL
jgi:hypothetical protein